MYCFDFFRLTDVQMYCFFFCFCLNVLLFFLLLSKCIAFSTAFVQMYCFFCCFCSNVLLFLRCRPPSCLLS